MIDHQEVAKPTRRLFLGGLGAALITGPSIVRAANLMPVKSVDLYDTRALIYYDIGWDEIRLRVDRSLTQMARPERGAWSVPIGVARKLMPKDAFLLQPPEGTQRFMCRIITRSELAAINYDLWDGHNSMTLQKTPTP